MMTIIKSESSCDTCMFWEESRDDDGEGIGDGACHRYPPSPQAAVAQKTGEYPYLTVFGACDWLLWPSTNYWEWCGEWKPITKESEKTRLWPSGIPGLGE